MSTESNCVVKVLYESVTNHGKDKLVAELQQKYEDLENRTNQACLKEQNDKLTKDLIRN